MLWPFLTLLAVVTGGLVVRYLLQREYAVREQLRHAQLELAQVRVAEHTELAEEQTKQQTVFNSLVEGLLIVDEHGQVQYANSTLEHLFGVTQDIRGRTLLEALRSPQLVALARQTLEAGRVTGFELLLPGIGERVLQVNATTFRDPDRAHAGTVFVFHDLTRLKQLENLRKEFVANVSHELRTPLSLIKGYVETLLDGAKDDPAVATRFLQTIEKHADRLTFLIEDLLTISRLESGQVLMNFQTLNLRSQAEAVVDDLATRAAERQVTLLNEVPPDLGVRADGDRLQQVLFNLVDNAIKYGRAGGQVRIGARRLQADLIEGWVADDGPGIPAEAGERVFERFYRLDRARSRDAGGTGLGLSIVKHIIQAHGGEVRLQSELGQGTTFFYTLPLGL
jgi:two-component system phosphate regulon sensor histidine kinase PhoR